MEEPTTTAGGTAPEVGVVSDSAVTEPTVDTTGAEGASAASEPTVEIDGEQVPLSKVKAGLGAMKDYTQTQQKQADRQRELDERELRLNRLGAIGANIDDPVVQEALSGVIPEFAVPSKEELASGELLAENIKLKFDLFSNAHPEFTADQIAGIRAEVLNLARNGRVDEALDFENVGFRLYRDDLIAAAAERARAEALAEAEQKRQERHQNGVLGNGTAPIPTDADVSKMSPLQKLSYGRRMREAAGR